MKKCDGSRLYELGRKVEVVEETKDALPSVEGNRRVAKKRESWSEGKSWRAGEAGRGACVKTRRAEV